MIHHLACIVTGEVQGVGYRYWLRQRAKAFGLRGYAINRSDGSVFFEAEGENEKLQHLLELSGMGPITGRVEKVEPQWSTREKYSLADGFEIRG